MTNKRMEQLTEKTTLVADDYIVIADSEDLNGTIPKSKKVKFSSLPMDYTIVSKVYADSPYTAVIGQDILVDATSGAVIVNLPAASGNSGKSIYVSKRDASANTVTIDGNGTETIDGNLTYIITIQYSGYLFVCDGSNWYIR